MFQRLYKFKYRILVLNLNLILPNEKMEAILFINVVRITIREIRETYVRYFYYISGAAQNHRYLC